MHATVFSAHAFEQPYLTRAANGRHELRFVAASLGPDTAAQAAGSAAVIVFTNDDVSAPVLAQLHAAGVRYVAIRAAGHDQTDLPAARRLGLRVASAPHYSPYAIAEHAVVLILALNRRLCRADRQVRAYDFRLDELVGFDLHGKTAGIVGLGRIGRAVARILHGFGCQLLAYDVAPDAALAAELGLAYTALADLCARADIITLHAPLNSDTQHLVDEKLLAQMKPGAMLINAGRGGALDTRAALAALRSGRLGYLGLDVYEHESPLFFADHSHEAHPDDLFAQLLAAPNVLVTGHQGFLTREALADIATATIDSLDCWARGEASATEL